MKNFKPGQQEIIESIMSQQHTLRYSSNWKWKEFVLSNTYVFYTGKPTLIISPLISLMDDQVMQLKINGEKRVTCIHSGMDEIEKKHNIKCLRHSRFIFLSPEFLLQPSNFKLISDDKTLA
ncbi:hypothetical protein UM582_13665 [Staphylococcus aureus]|nr:hypothetical protein UM582_13665 [Staphylococcus aureus]